MGSGNIPSVSTSETFIDNFQKTNTGVEDKQNVDGGWSSDGKASPEPIMCAPTGMD